MLVIQRNHIKLWKSLIWLKFLSILQNVFYFTASNDDVDADKDYTLPNADSNIDFNLEESDYVDHTNYSLVDGMYLLFNLFNFCVYILTFYIQMIQFINMFMFSVYTI